MRNRSPTRTAIVAFLASFSIYLLPILRPHGAPMPWGVLLIARTSSQWSRHPEWLTADLTLAATVQAAAWVFFFLWLHCRGWLRAVVLVVAIPIAWWGIHGGFQSLIPKKHLVEPERAPEQTSWPTECLRPDVSLVQELKTPVTLDEAAPEQAWVVRADMSYALLRMPGCELEELDAILKGANYIGQEAYIDFALPGGTVLARISDSTTKSTKRWLIPTGQAPIAIDDPPTHTQSDESPILSNDGTWIAWGVRDRSADGAMEFAVLFRRLSDGYETRLPFLGFVRNGVEELLELSSDATELVVSSHSDEYLGVGKDGSIHWRATAPAAGPFGYRRIGTGHVAWGDDYIDNGPSTVTWSLETGSGTHRIPRGRHIASAAASADGRFVAVSVRPSTKLRGAEESIYVVQTSDGAEVFRKFLDRYEKGTVAFLGTRYFAYSDKRGTHVLRLPE